MLRKLKEVIYDLLKTKENTPAFEEEMQILLKAMVNAAKSDGVIDEIEQLRIVNFMGDMSSKQKEFVQEEMVKPLDLTAFVKEIPVSMKEQVYYMSLYTIDIDEEAEVDYLDALANELDLDIEVINTIQESLGRTEVAV